MHVEPIAHIRECDAGAPAQGACVQLVFSGAYRNADALRGIEGFSHLWLVWGAREGEDAAADAGGTLPFHAPQTPAGLGLACARLEGVQRTGTQGTVLVLSGVPLAPGTPVYDVKPYLPYADAHPQAGEVHDDAR